MRHLLVIAVVMLARSGNAYAWGERGHDVIARVAARIVLARMADDPSLSTPLVQRENMLGHLANVPDIVWRATGDAKVDKANGPTHFVNWEKLGITKASQVPREYAKAAKIAKDRGVDLANDVGTAPWRVQELAEAMQKSLAKAKTLETGQAFEDAVNEALLYGGLLAHFVGDLAQPYHNSQDYDGWPTHQGGIHAYFESDLVSALPLELDAAVLRVALASAPAKALTTTTDAFTIALAESFDAQAHLPDVRALDLRYAVISKSEGKTKATRRPAEAVARYFDARLTERLATAADVLATIWLNTWVAAGRPDMRGYHSYAYPVAPAFVPPSYVTP